MMAFPRFTDAKKPFNAQNQTVSEAAAEARGPRCFQGLIFLAPFFREDLAGKHSVKTFHMQDLLGVFHKVASENNISYFLYGGTLLGYIVYFKAGIFST